jgi:hypothetical protein
MGDARRESTLWFARPARAVRNTLPVFSKTSDAAEGELGRLHTDR